MPLVDKQARSNYDKAYVEANKARVSSRHAAYRESHRAQILRYVTEYNKRPEIKAKRKALRKQYCSPKLRLRRNLARRIRKTLGGSDKSARTLELIGCSVAELRTSLEAKFTEGMTWANYGVNGWHVDHIVPCANFNLTQPDQQRQCFHFSNLQPLWAWQNLSKGSD